MEDKSMNKKKRKELNAKNRIPIPPLGNVFRKKKRKLPREWKESDYEREEGKCTN